MQETIVKRWGINAIAILGLLLLWRTQTYLLFHTVIELASLFLATSLYIIGAQTYRYSKNQVLLCISIAFVYVGLFDLLHTLTYRGMVVAEWGTANMSAQFWVAGRMIQIMALSYILVIPRLKVSRYAMEVTLASTFLLLSFLVFTGFFPDCNVEGIGLTPFKKTVEYVIVLIAVLAIFLVNKVGGIHSERIKRNVRLSLLFFVASELSFTLYKDAYGVLNAAGHFFKVISYMYIWTMVLDEGFSKPYEHLFRDVYNKSVKDQLTGLYNRRYFEQEIGPLLEGDQGGFCLVMADVNGLKLINDAFGHEEGDSLLKTFTEVLKRHCSDVDILMRIGGDEFLILMPGRTLRETASIIERMKVDFSKNSTRGIPFSASFGFTEKWDVAESKEILFNRAESEMYRRKVAESPVMKRRIIDGVLKYIQEFDTAEQSHSIAVAGYSERIAQQLGLPKEKIRQIREAGLLHDIGKIRFINANAHTVDKSAAKGSQDFQHHPEVGYNLLVSLSDYAQLAPFILHHHENWDGTGYPLGLVGEEIPMEARIIAVAEAYDAMISGRSKQVLRTKSEAIDEIKRCSGTQFDPDISTIFVEILESKT